MHFLLDLAGTIKTSIHPLDRYEREVNHGHQSAVKRILEGDVPPSSMMVLCVSNIYSICVSPVGPQSSLSSTTENGTCAKVELTDGW